MLPGIFTGQKVGALGVGVYTGGLDFQKSGKKQQHEALENIKDNIKVLDSISDNPGFKSLDPQFYNDALIEETQAQAAMESAQAQSLAISKFSIIPLSLADVLEPRPEIIQRAQVFGTKVNSIQNSVHLLI